MTKKVKTQTHYELFIDHVGFNEIKEGKRKQEVYPYGEELINSSIGDTILLFDSLTEEVLPITLLEVERFNSLDEILEKYGRQELGYLYQKDTPVNYYIEYQQILCVSDNGFALIRF